MRSIQITKDTLIGELLEAHPEAEEVIRARLGDVGCLSCPGKYFDTIEAGALLHGMSSDEVNQLVSDIRKTIHM